MKAMVRSYSALLLVASLALQTAVMAAGDPLVEKKKTFSKSYSVTSADKIKVSNSFGEMKISTWSKNEVKVDATITAEAGSDERAQKLLDAISIDADNSGNDVTFKTRIGDNNNSREKGEKQSFSINMVVYVPDGYQFTATNEFGPMSIGDYNGPANFVSKFGSFTAGKLTKAKVLVEFGKVNLGAFNSGTLAIKFSRGLIENVTGDVRGTFEHCSGIKLNLQNSIKSLDVKNDFTPLYVDVPTSISASFNVKTSFGELSNKTSFPIKKDDDDEDSHGPKFDHQYIGVAGSGSASVRIKASFQTVTIGHNLSFDIDKDDDKKDRKRTRNI
ncbi:hypothetical protein [Paraflavitalea sp. CAU 1676]|uniref:hypothetical protein n=1 Tax=Paraflavitalea sp. CAU 1676 TaxID=3032598 RepID=UPI0023D9DC09|nr:hypothetical protein [Paraflavitalea sp. CAU 1676]MDF2192536.1 hypothetical protein [Paraflavitalea sp. CAU 1676]